jgi:hypothetical protein
MVYVLSNFEISDKGLPIVGATVELRVAADTQPNVSSVVSATTTDTNGKWSFTGLTQTVLYDVKISIPGSDEVRWYKANAQIGLYALNAVTGLYIPAGLIVNADVSAAAAIARSKLDFGSGLTNADLAAAAAIAYSKLALTGSITNADLLAGTSAMKKIGEQAGSGGSAALVISSIPGTYRGLYVECKLRADVSAASNVTITLYINSDGSGNYNYQDVQVITSGVSASEARSAAGIFLGHAPDSTAPANSYGALRFWLPNYAGAHHKVVEAENYCYYVNSASGQIGHHSKGQWMNTAAITSIDIRSSGTGLWSSASLMTLWGVPA